MGLSVGEHAAMLKQLLPRGALWFLESGTKLSSAFLAIAEELVRVNDRGDDMIDETDPRTALETLADWEEMLGLPDDALTTIPTTISERQVAVASKFASRGGQSPAFFIALAASLGYAVTITEYRPFRCGVGVSGDRCQDSDWAYAWAMNLPISSPAADVLFRSGTGRSGDRIRGYGSLDIRNVVLRSKPAHTTVIFNFT